MQYLYKKIILLLTVITLGRNSVLFCQENAFVEIRDKNNNLHVFLYEDSVLKMFSLNAENEFGNGRDIFCGSGDSALKKCINGKKDFIYFLLSGNEIVFVYFDDLNRVTVKQVNMVNVNCSRCIYCAVGNNSIDMYCLFDSEVKAFSFDWNFNLISSQTVMTDVKDFKICSYENDIFLAGIYSNGNGFVVRKNHGLKNEVLLSGEKFSGIEDFHVVKKGPLFFAGFLQDSGVTKNFVVENGNLFECSNSSWYFFGKQEQNDVYFSRKDERIIVFSENKVLDEIETGLEEIIFYRPEYGFILQGKNYITKIEHASFKKKNLLTANKNILHSEVVWTDERMDLICLTEDGLFYREGL